MYGGQENFQGYRRGIILDIRPDKSGHRHKRLTMSFIKFYVPQVFLCFGNQKRPYRACFPPIDGPNRPVLKLLSAHFQQGVVEFPGGDSHFFGDALFAFINGIGRDIIDHADLPCVQIHIAVA